MNRFLQYARLLALPLAAALPALGQGVDGISRQQADEILKELRQIRQLLEKQQQGRGEEKEAVVKAKVSVQGLQLLGDKNAPLTMVEFTDYQCPFCRQFHDNTFPELKKNYIDAGKLRFYSRDLPLDFHANAMRAAQAARCGVEQGQYWALRDLMASNPDKLDMDNIVNFANSLRMDGKALRACVESGKYKEAVQTDVMEAMKIGANGTPSFVVGASTPDGVDGELVVGALPFAMFDAKLKELLK